MGGARTRGRRGEAGGVRQVADGRAHGEAGEAGEAGEVGEVDGDRERVRDE